MVLGVVLLETPAGVNDAEVIELAELEEPIIEASARVVDAAQAHTALAEAATARPVLADFGISITQNRGKN